MSGKYWWPLAMVSRVVASPKWTPSAELATKTLACPLGCSADQTTWTPVQSAVMAERLPKREKVRPDGHASGPSPQSAEPLPLNWLESNARIRATSWGSENETPPSIERLIQTPSKVDPWTLVVRKVRYSVPSGATAEQTRRRHQVQGRLEALRAEHARKPSLIGRLDKRSL